MKKYTFVTCIQWKAGVRSIGKRFVKNNLKDKKPAHNNQGLNAAER